MHLGLKSNWRVTAAEVNVLGRRCLAVIWVGWSVAVLCISPVDARSSPPNTQPIEYALMATQQPLHLMFNFLRSLDSPFTNDIAGKLL